MLNVVWLNGTTPLGKSGVVTSGGSSGGSSSSGSRWTGHADVEGLKAIGWDDEDIAYYQEHGVNWNEEDDQYHKVPEDNIALYGVLTANNISTYKDIIVYLPKIDTSGITSMKKMFYNCYSLVAIPLLDTSNVNDMSYMFYSCGSLISIPQLDTNKVQSMSSMFDGCYSLISIPQLNMSKVTNINSMFYSCYSLNSIPQLDTSKVTGMDSTFNGCHSLTFIPQLNVSKLYNLTYTFSYCFSIQTIKLDRLRNSLPISNISLLTKESLLYIINNESATSAITITLSSYCYTKYAEDADVVAALANHPNISIAS